MIPPGALQLLASHMRWTLPVHAEAFRARMRRQRLGVPQTLRSETPRPSALRHARREREGVAPAGRVRFAVDRDRA